MRVTSVSEQQAWLTVNQAQSGSWFRNYQSVVVDWVIRCESNVCLKIMYMVDSQSWSRRAQSESWWSKMSTQKRARVMNERQRGGLCKRAKHRHQTSCRMFQICCRLWVWRKSLCQCYNTVLVAEIKVLKIHNKSKRHMDRERILTLTQKLIIQCLQKTLHGWCRKLETAVKIYYKFICTYFPDSYCLVLRPHGFTH